MAFVAATQLFKYWQGNDMTDAVIYRETIVRERLTEIAAKYPQLEATVRGKGMINGLHIPAQNFCSEVSKEAFSRGLIIELAGANDDVLKLLPSLIIEEEVLRAGLIIIDESIGAVLEKIESLVTGQGS